MKILITGSTGFIGSRVFDVALGLEWDVKIQRRGNEPWTAQTIFTSIGVDTDWSTALDDIDCIVYCAGRAHQMKGSVVEALAAYREVNTQGTLNLARQAAAAGVKRFVFLSSIKVNGESSLPEQPFLPEVFTAPMDAYALSKYEAEVGLQKVAKETGIEVVIIRPPLVYGEGVKANFFSLMKWIKKGLPLPLGAIHNRRSLVYRENLVSLILTCCKHERAPGEVFFVSDNNDVSTTGLLKQVALSMHKPFLMLPIPMGFIQTLASAVGKSEMATRLCGDLHVDISHTMERLDWKPPVSFEKGIENTVNAFQGKI